MTQTTSQVEMAIERIKTLAGQYAMSLATYGSASPAALETAIRAELASRQEVAAVGDVEIKAIAKKNGAFDAGDHRGLILWENMGANGDGLRGFARDLLAAARVPVASPAEPDAWLIEFRHPGAADVVSRVAYTHNAIGDYKSMLDPEATSTPLYRATPPVGAGVAGVMDARPDSFHSDSGECDRVQGPVPTDGERATLTKIPAAFDANPEGIKRGQHAPKISTETGFKE